MEKISFYTIDPNYILYLQKFDHKVPRAYDEKEKRPFIGAKIKINSVFYYIPLTSPKEKHKKMKNAIDFHKINGGIYGAINLNNMIPVPDKCLEKIIPNLTKCESEKDTAYIALLNNQLTWCNILENRAIIIKKAYKLHKKVLETTEENSLTNRCCNYVLLEEKCKEYTVKD